MTQVSTAITIGAVITAAGGIIMGFEEALIFGSVLVIVGIALAVIRRKVTR